MTNRFSYISSDIKSVGLQSVKGKFVLLCDRSLSKVKSLLSSFLRNTKRFLYLPVLNFILVRSRARYKITTHDNVSNKIPFNRVLESSTFEVPAVYQVDIFGNEKIIKPSEIVYCKQICVLEFKEIYAEANSNILYTNKRAVVHNDFNFISDYTSEELHGRIYIKKGFLARSKLKTNAKIENAALFLDALSSNYAHWLTEVLTRVVMFSKVDKYNDASIIIDSSWHPNMIEILNHVVSGRNVFIAKPDVVLSAQDALIVTSCGYVPFEPRPGYKGLLSSGAFNIKALRFIREKLLPIAPPSDYRKVYLRRRSWGRNALNADDVEKALSMIGFVTYDPSIISVSQQISIFANADIIYSNSGAALANIVFCKPGCIVYISIPDVEGTSYQYWNKIAQASGAIVKYFVEQPIYKSIHSNFEVNINRLLKVFAK